jgi:hypothetical protein
VDRLAERVRRAADLVQLCRGRLDAARVEVTRIVADLEAVAPLDAGEASAESTAGTADDTAPGDGREDGPGEEPGGLFAAGS